MLGALSMSPDNSLDAAKSGDLSAISSLIQQAFAPQEICIDVEMQFGVVLWLQLKSDKSLDSQNCLNVISRTLDSIRPEKIASVRISETSPKDPKQQVWNKYLILKQGKFVDNTTANNIMACALAGVVALGMVFASVMYKPTSTTFSSTTSTSLSSTADRTFFGKSQTGYELWADKNCIYVKGITEADLARLNTNVWEFKDEIKAQTNYKCVLFE